MVDVSPRMVLGVGRQFDSLKEFQQIVRENAISFYVELRVIKLDKTRFT
jgi:hypothetical protein